MFTSMFDAMGNAESTSTIDQGSTDAASSSILRLRSRHARPHTGATAFVFSGGGARGALHVGAIRTLLEADIYPDMVVGASIGAWNAAWLAQSLNLAGVEALADIRQRQLATRWTACASPNPLHA